MSEEIAAADALLTANAVQRAQIAELSRQVAELRALVARAIQHLDSFGEIGTPIAAMAEDLEVRLSKVGTTPDPLRGALIDLLNQLALLTRDDVSYLWRIGGRPLDEAYKAAKRAIDETKASE